MPVTERSVLALSRARTAIEVDSPLETDLSMTGCGMLFMAGAAAGFLPRFVAEGHAMGWVVAAALALAAVCGALRALVSVWIELDNPGRRLVLVQRFAWLFRREVAIARFEDVDLVTIRMPRPTPPGPRETQDRDLVLVLADGRALRLAPTLGSDAAAAATAEALARHLGAGYVPGVRGQYPKLEWEGNRIRLTRVPAGSPGPVRQKGSRVLESETFFEEVVAHPDHPPEAKPNAPYQAAMDTEDAAGGVVGGLGCAVIMAFPALAIGLPVLETVLLYANANPWFQGACLAVAASVICFFTSPVVAGLVHAVTRALELPGLRPPTPRSTFPDPPMHLFLGGWTASGLCAVLALPLLMAGILLDLVGNLPPPTSLLWVAPVVFTTVAGLALPALAGKAPAALPGIRPEAPALPPSRRTELVARLGAGDVSCPYCGSPVTEAGTVACNGCEALHHGECWREAGVCTTYACGQRRATPIGALLLAALLLATPGGGAGRLLAEGGDAWIAGEAVIAIGRAGSGEAPAAFCEGVYLAGSPAELARYLARLRDSPRLAEHLEIGFSLRAEVVEVETPCRVTITERSSILAGRLLLVAGRGLRLEGTSVIAAETALVLRAPAGELRVGGGARVSGRRVELTGAAIQIGENVTIRAGGEAALTTQGPGGSGKLEIETGTVVSATRLRLAASGELEVEPRVDLDAPGGLVLEGSSCDVDEESYRSVSAVTGTCGPGP